MPRVIHVDPASPSASAMLEAAAVLGAGGLVAFPTETVYGLGALGLDPDAVAKVFEAKGRPGTHPLILHVAGEKQAREVTASFGERAHRLASEFWPGPLTLVLPRGERVPSIVTGGGDTVAVRSPAHPVALALLRAVGEPIAAPSANRYQSISPTAAAHVVKSLGDRVDLILDSGPCSVGIESTVLDLVSDPPRVLRPGALGLAALRRLVPDLATFEPESARGVRRSPGMDSHNYAPRARIEIVYGAEALAALARERAEQGLSIGVLARGPCSLEAAGVRVTERRLPSDAEGYARGLFAALHEMDDAGVDVVLVEEVPGDEAWCAIADRLKRART